MTAYPAQVSRGTAYLTILVRRSTPDKAKPITAFVSGTSVEGIGDTVWAALEDLFSDARVGQAAQQLER